MKILYVDKIDGALVICESDNEEETRRYALPMEDAPAGVITTPASLHSSTARLAVPGMANKLTKYPPLGSFHFAISKGLISRSSQRVTTWNLGAIMAAWRFMISRVCALSCK